MLYPNVSPGKSAGMRLPTCSTCRWRINGTCRWRINGTCRRHAPTIVRGLLNGEAGTFAVWPQVEDGHGCGDHVFATRTEA